MADEMIETTDEMIVTADEMIATADEMIETEEMSMCNAAHKTPISLLQELCAQFGMTPDYKLMSVEGAVHAPTFMYRVQVSDVAVSATGQSKKKAKHAAAKVVLEKLLSADGEYSKGFVADGVMVNAENLNEVIADQMLNPVVVEEDDECFALNPVGALQEKCMKYRWQPPYYETERATGLPHEKVFYMACYVDKFREIGEGKSKRLAKKQAANKMLKRLENLNIECPEETLKLDDLKLYEEKYDDSNSGQSNLQKTYTKNVLKFLKDLKTSSGSLLQALQEVDLMDTNLNCQKLIQNIAAEQNFEVVYIPVEEQSKNGDFHCLIQITSLPVAVCFGSGATREEAKTSSARNALNFIQLMNKK